MATKERLANQSRKVEASKAKQNKIKQNRISNKETNIELPGDRRGGNVVDFRSCKKDPPSIGLKMQVRSMPEAVDTRAGMSAFSSTQ